MTLKSFAVLVIAAMLLGACGGGSPDAQPPATSNANGSPHLWQDIVTSVGRAVWPNGAPPVIDVQPAGASVVVGTSKTLAVHATGTAPLAYQWLRGGTAIAGATGSSYTFTPSYGDDGTSFTVNVTNAGGQATSQAATLAVIPATSAALIGACQEITSPGAYRLFSDVSPRNGSTCISIHDTHDVQLDCAGHTIARNVSAQGEALSIANAQNFSLKNCTIVAYWLNVTATSNGSVTNSTVATASDAVWATAVVNVVHSSRFTFDGNTIASGTYQQMYGDRNTISRNHMTSSAGANAGAANIVSNLGSGTRILANVLDGRSTGRIPGINEGMDDGIVLGDETDASIEDNSIQNVWDCGIEFTGVLATATVRHNHIVNASYCGIGGWYWFSMSDAKFVANTVEASGSLFQFSRFFGLRPAGWDDDHLAPADAAVNFTNNLFQANLLVNQAPFLGVLNGAAAFSVSYYINSGLVVSDIAGERLPAPSDFHLANNTFIDNDFGHSQMIAFGDLDALPAGMYVDGGGNTCVAFAYPTYPLACR